MMKYIHEDPRIEKYLSSIDHDATVISHFFHELGQSQEKTMEGFLSNFLKQILVRFPDNAPPLILEFKQLRRMNSQQDQRQIWTESRLKKSINTMISRWKNPTTILFFIDGLDECEGDHREQLEFILKLFPMAESSGKLSIRLCLASRPLREIEVRLFGFPQCKIHEYTASDISKYVKDKLGLTQNMLAARGQSITDDIFRRLLKEILDKAKGVFLWVELVVKNLIIGLEEGDTVDELQERLHSLPSDLESMYSRILLQIKDIYIHETINYNNLLQRFSFTMHGLIEFTLANRHLDDCLSQEPQHGIESHLQLRKECEIMEIRIKSRCRGLIQVSESPFRSRIQDEQCVLLEPMQRKVNFLHLTVQKYFNREDVQGSLALRADRKKVRETKLAGLSSLLTSLKLVPPEFLFQGYDDRKIQPSLLACYVAGCNFVSKDQGEGSWESISKDLDGKTNESDEGDSYATKDFVAASKLEVFFNLARLIEMATKTSPASLIEEVHRVCVDSQSNWFKIFYASKMEPHRRMITYDSNDNNDLVSFALYRGLDIFVREQIELHGYDASKKLGRPLLHYFVDGLIHHWSKNNSRLLVLKFLLGMGLSPNEKYNGSSSWMLVLSDIQASSRIYYYRVTPLMRIIEAMLEYGADPDIATNIEDDYVPVIILFIRNMEEKAKAWEGDLAVLDFWKEIFTLFLNYGANLEPDWAGGTTVLEEAEKKQPAIKKFLLDTIAKHQAASKSQRKQDKEFTLREKE